MQLNISLEQVKRACIYGWTKMSSLLRMKEESSNKSHNEDSVTNVLCLSLGSVSWNFEEWKSWKMRVSKVGEFIEIKKYTREPPVLGGVPREGCQRNDLV
jgi:hypothetical protein